MSHDVTIGRGPGLSLSASTKQQAVSSEERGAQYRIRHSYNTTFYMITTQLFHDPVSLAGGVHLLCCHLMSLFKVLILLVIIIKHQLPSPES